MMSKVKKVVTIEEKLTALFELRNEIKNTKAKEADLVQEICNYADEHISDFIENQLPLENGVIKIKANPPKLVHQGSEKALTTVQRVEFAENLPKDYVELKPNLTKMIARVNGDKGLKQLLQSKKIEVIQSNKFDIKPY